MFQKRVQDSCKPLISKKDKKYQPTAASFSSSVPNGVMNTGESKHKFRQEKLNCCSVIKSHNLAK
jgi:hypothetical protein